MHCTNLFNTGLYLSNGKNYTDPGYDYLLTSYYLHVYQKGGIIFNRAGQVHVGQAV